MADLLVVPLKKSSDVDIIKPLKNLIQSTYNTAENNEDFNDAINELSRLRNYAIWKVFEKSSLDVLYSYYDQLVYLERKIPPQEVQIPFKWKDAFDKGSIFGGRMSLTISSLAYERICILFNIAAMQSALAAQQTLDTEESLKLAAKLLQFLYCLQQSAGIFAYLKANVMLAVHQEPTPDLSPETLSTLSQLMLAQAQEVIAYKCMKDEMKDSMVAKVCAQCQELYMDVVRALQRDTRQWVDRDWLTTAQSKESIFSGLANYYQAQVCRANKCFGEEIARLKVAAELLKAGRERSPAAEASVRAARQLAAAERDNDFIYHERVPEPRTLEPVARAPVAAPLPPQERWVPGQADLFDKLVPMAVHQALQATAARRADLVGAEINGLREDTQLLNSILASLDLPACIEAANGAGGGLPDSIRSKAAAVRDAGGLPALERLMAELPELLQRNREILMEAERMLREEAEADAALRTQFGPRWTRTDSDKLTEAFRANAAKYTQIIDNAVRADSIVQQKFQQHRESIELLSRSDGEIGADVPDAPDAAPTDTDALRTLRGLMTTVEELKAERDAIEAELKSATVDLREQFMAALAADGAVDEARVSAGALGAALAPLQRRAAAARSRQEELATRLRAAHDALMAARGGASGRERALTKLSSAGEAYQDLTNNLKEGVKFYNDLTQLLVAFQNKVSDFCFARKTEKEELLKDLTHEASRTSQRPAPAPPQHHVAAASEPPAVAKRDAPPRPPPPSAGPAASPVAAASLPYPQQPQGMPLPYGAAPAPYAVYAPMPAMYNPYATLPYSRMHPGLLAWECIVFALFVCASSCLPLWQRKKDAAAAGDAKRAYIFAGGGVSTLSMILSVSRGTLGVRSFLGFPSELVYFGSAMWETLYGMMLAFPFVCWIFIPVYYRLSTNSVYEYLQLRFGSTWVRRLAAATFLLRQTLNLAITVYTPTVALHAVLALPHWASAAALTIVGVVFNLLGGLAAAIRADVIQTLTMVLVSGAFIIQATIQAGGPGQVITDNIEGRRLEFMKFTWDPTVRVDTLSALVGQLFMSVSIYGCQQTFVQRYCSMSSESRVRKTLLANVPAVFVLFSLSWVVGMVLYALYKYCDPLLSGKIVAKDEVLPFYVQDQFNFLPGMLGLFLGSIFNGALSFLVSNMNSLSTVTWEDFVSAAPAFKGISNKQQLVVIKIIGVIYAIIIMGLSLCVGMVGGVIEGSLLVTSATSGAMLGVFLLAAIFPMANGKGALCGMLASHFITTWMAVGRILYVNDKKAMLPLSIETCPNSTLSVLDHKLLGSENTTIAQIAQVVHVLDKHHFNRDKDYSPIFSALMRMYSVSYMWYSVIGTVTCICIGIIIGLITASESDAFEENLLHPLVAKIARKMPGKKRTFTTNSKEKVVEVKEVEKMEETAVEVKSVLASNGSRLFDAYESSMQSRTRL